MIQDLFTPCTRDQRQEESKVKWVKNKCKGTIEACTGFGKTRVAINCIEMVLKKFPKFRTLIVVPTETLKEQWITSLNERGIYFGFEVIIINTLIKNNYDCDILIIDEIHRVAADTFSKVFNVVSYKMILGLTATLKRLDEKHTIIEKYCPVVDSISIEVALTNGWVSKFTEYKVCIKCDLTDYNNYTREFNEHFDFFGYDFNLAMSMVGPKGISNRLKYRDERCTNGDAAAKSEMLKAITVHATGLMRTMQKRKAFINKHEKKLELARKIIAARPDSKIITFSATIEMAEKIGIGNVYSSKSSKKKSRMTLEEFETMEKGVLNTSKKADEGLDCKGLSVAIVLGMDSSSTKSIQRKGRVIRAEGDKQAEIFNLVITGTVEEEWFRKSHEGSTYISIDEENLYKVLKGEPYEVVKKKPPQFSFRF